MSVWKRLSNVARGTVKVWSQGADGPTDPAVEEELSELRRHPPSGDPHEATIRRARARADEPLPETSGKVRNAADEPVPRTDLFPNEAVEPEVVGESADRSAVEDAEEIDEDAVRTSDTGRRL